MKAADNKLTEDQERNLKNIANGVGLNTIAVLMRMLSDRHHMAIAALHAGFEDEKIYFASQVDGLNKKINELLTTKL